MRASFLLAVAAVVVFSLAALDLATDVNLAAIGAALFAASFASYLYERREHR